MIRVSTNFAKAMEFTSFRKKENVTDDDLMNAVLRFETALGKQKGLIFHCLVHNFKNEYANVLFVEQIGDLEPLIKTIRSAHEATDFLALIEPETIKMTCHEILKDRFAVPEGFSCIEHGSFTLKENLNIDSLIKVSGDLEKNYLNKFDNNLGHFVGRVSDNLVSEISIGKTYAKTKQECYGYFDNQYGQAFLELANLETVDLDFWYLTA